MVLKMCMVLKISWCGWHPLQFGPEIIEQGETGDGRLISARIDSQKVWADVSKGER